MEATTAVLFKKAENSEVNKDILSKEYRYDGLKSLLEINAIKEVFSNTMETNNKRTSVIKEGLTNPCSILSKVIKSKK